MNTPVDRIIRDATWLADALEPLHATRLKGTPRPWRQTELTPEQRAALDTEARAEKAARGAGAFGESPAPVHLDIIDLEQAINATALNICRAINRHRPQTDIAPLLEEHVHRTTAITRLRYIVLNAHHLVVNDADTEHAAYKLHQHRASVERQWQEITIGQRLKAACPWCGHEALRFRHIGNPDNPEVVLRCESGQCEPDEAHCGTWHRGYPCWPMHEWPWLREWIDAQHAA